MSASTNNQLAQENLDSMAHLVGSIASDTLPSTDSDVDSPQSHNSNELLQNTLHDNSETQKVLQGLVDNQMQYFNRTIGRCIDTVHSNEWQSEIIYGPRSQPSSSIVIPSPSQLAAQLKRLHLDKATIGFATADRPHLRLLQMSVMSDEIQSLLRQVNGQLQNESTHQFIYDSIDLLQKRNEELEYCQLLYSRNCDSFE